MKNDPKAGLWRCAPLVLASKSAGRHLALAQTGAPFEIVPADIDERALEGQVVAKGGGADQIAAALALAKALAVSAPAPGRYVIGADQVASCEGRIFGKPVDMGAAKALLAFLSGRTHRLHSAIALARDGVPVMQTVARADMTMRRLTDDFIDAYLAEIGEAALTSAGAYQVEGLGAHLFADIAGDHWTILGLPLLPLLDALRHEGALLS